jgi:translocation and assembly module TamA
MSAAARSCIAAALCVAAPLPAAAQVAITGVEGEVLANVEEYLGEEPECDVDRGAVDSFVGELPERLRPALEAYGYYQPQIDAAVQPRGEACWSAAVRIDPGPQIAVREIDLALEGEAREDARMRALFDAFPLAEGAALRHGDYLAFKDLVEAVARERGYLDARFTAERIDVYVDESAADVALAFDSGPRAAFGPTTFDVEGLSEQVLQSFLPYSRGQPYDAELVADLQRDLTGSQYFLRASVAPQIDAAANGEVPVRVEGALARPTSYSIGTGFSTDDGPRLRFQYENVRRNAAGHQLDASLLLAGVRQNATFDYKIPIGSPQRDWLSARAGIEREDIDAGVGSVARLGLRRIHAGEGLTNTRFVDLLYEQDDIGGEDLTTRLLLPGMSWARSYRDDFVRPLEGHRLSFGVTLGVGDMSLAQFDLHGKWITELPWDARFIARGRVGVLLEDDEFERVPLSLRFFSGGDNSVRGYDFESLGPRNALGELIGGNRLLEASAEYEHRVLESWAVAAFVDAGNAFLDSDLTARRSAGIGARWFSPIGPVRIDIAWPANPPPGEDRSPRLHISLGPDI